MIFYYFLAGHGFSAIAEKLTAEGVAARVVSMPSWDLFEKQTQD